MLSEMKTGIGWVIGGWSLASRVVDSFSPSPPTSDIRQINYLLGIRLSHIEHRPTHD